MELQKPNHLISLASSGVLISLDISVWSATKQDRGISDEITTAKRADKSAGRYTKNLLADHPKHKAVVNYRQTMYNWMKRRTYRWNNSQELLPSIDMPRFKQEYHDHERQFNNLVDEFIDAYEGIVSDMAFKQGDMFNRNDYPHKDQVRSKFALNLYVSEVPMSDFRCNIAQDIAEDLFRTYEKQTADIISSIQGEQANRFIEVMQSIAHCCGYDEMPLAAGATEVKTKKRKIYDTTIQKALEMCESFKGFNLTNDSALEEARASLEKLLHNTTPEQLRESDAVRSTVKDGINDILNKFAPLNTY